MKPTFRAGVRTALANPALQEALDQNAARRRAGWEAAFASLPQSEARKRQAAEIRRRTIAKLDAHLETFTAQLQARGVVVHRAEDGAAGCSAVLAILQSHGVHRVVKAKSMVTEEIGLNRALVAAGIEVVETDLGEFIVQLRGEPPAHITAPAIHLRREDVGRTFEQHLGLAFTTDVAEMTAAARHALRDRFFEAEAGISGVNFGVAETGTLCLVTNEGNGRMVTSLPALQIAIMGMERLVPSLADLAVMLDVLPRAATGQARTSYVSLLQGPRGAGDPDGAFERHVVLVDNGRSAVRESSLAEALSCIRCGACLNACPVYQEVGGHAYGSTYPGPIGSVLSPALWGVGRYGHLARASTLCGACRDACPVGIDLPTLLLRVRAEQTRTGRPSLWLSVGMRLFAWAIASPACFGPTSGSGWLASSPATTGGSGWLPSRSAAGRIGGDFPRLPAGRSASGDLLAGSDTDAVTSHEVADCRRSPLLLSRPLRSGEGAVG
jgi:L-lactate dehydrogenase complex protein LldF